MLCSQITLKPTIMLIRFTYSLKKKKLQFFFSVSYLSFKPSIILLDQKKKSTEAGNCARKFRFIPIIIEAVSKDIAKHNELIRNDD